MKYLNISILLLALFSIGCGGPQQEESARLFALGEPYMHSVVAENGTGRYEMSAKSFLPANGKGPKVTLIGMIHIGELSYYAKVQEHINQADSVLWEGIGSSPQGDNYLLKALFIPACMTLMELINHGNTAAELGLVSQQLSYPPESAVWADLGIEPLLDQFLNTSFAQNKYQQMPNTRDTSKCYQVLWLFNEGLKAKPNPEIGTLTLLAEPEVVKDQIRQLQQKNAIKLSRKGLALSKSTSDNEIFPGFSEVLLNRRNDVVLEKLAQVLRYNSGNEILIVYGAAHMPDIENRFTKQHNYVPDREHRLVAFTF